jgi:hypothetical protein
MKRTAMVPVLALCMLGLSGGRAPGAAIAADQFATLHALIRPAAGEDQWAAVPWRTNLWQARQEAAAQGKPILLWEMDGHPLGCT